MQKFNALRDFFYI